MSFVASGLPLPAGFSRIRIREQPERLIIDIETTGQADDGMLALIDYLCGANAEARSIALNAPLKLGGKDRVRTPFAPRPGLSSSGSGITSFMLSCHRERLPEPDNPRIKLTVLPAYRVLSVRFFGSPTPSRVARHTSSLRDFMGVRGLLPMGSASETAVVSVADFGFFCISGLSVMVAPWSQLARPRVAGKLFPRGGLKHPARASMKL
jgi:hypothetical protein